MQLELDAASGTLTVLDDTLEHSEPQKSQGSRSERNLDFQIRVDEAKVCNYTIFLEKKHPPILRGESNRQPYKNIKKYGHFQGISVIII